MDLLLALYQSPLTDNESLHESRMQVKRFILGHEFKEFILIITFTMPVTIFVLSNLLKDTTVTPMVAVSRDICE